MATRCTNLACGLTIPELGGGTVAGGAFHITGTIGQADANPQLSPGGGLVLAGGHWARANNSIFRNGSEGGDP